MVLATKYVVPELEFVFCVFCGAVMIGTAVMIGFAVEFTVTWTGFDDAAINAGAACVITPVLLVRATLHAIFRLSQFFHGK